MCGVWFKKFDCVVEWDYFNTKRSKKNKMECVFTTSRKLYILPDTVIGRPYVALGRILTLFEIVARISGRSGPNGGIIGFSFP